MKMVQGAQFTDASYCFGEKEELLNDTDDVPKKRYLAKSNELPRDLGLKAALKLINNSQVDPKKIDLILYSTSFMEAVNIGFGPYIQKNIGASNATVLQLDCACASFLAQIELADAWIKANKYQKILLLNVSHMISRLDEAILQKPGCLLGEGAAAVLLEHGTKSFFVEHSPINSEDSMFNKSPYPMRKEQDDWHANGSGFTFSLDYMTNKSQLQSIALSFHRMLKHNDLLLSDIDLVLGNYPNPGFIEHIFDAIGLSKDLLFKTFEQSGDLAQASIGVHLAMLKERKELSLYKNIGLINFSLDSEHVLTGLMKP